MMVKVLLHAYATGVFSSRKVARKLHEDVAFRVLAAGNFPAHRTLSDFRAIHLKELSELFVQVVRLAREMGLVKLGAVAIDGTKVKANASRHKAMSYGHMVKVEAELTNNASDAGLLPGMLQVVRDTLAQRPHQALRSKQTFRELDGCGTERVVALGREGKHRLGFDRERNPHTAQMADKLDSEAGKTAYAAAARFNCKRCVSCRTHGWRLACYLERRDPGRSARQPDVPTQRHAQNKTNAEARPCSAPPLTLHPRHRPNRCPPLPRWPCTHSPARSGRRLSTSVPRPS